MPDNWTRVRTSSCRAGLYSCLWEVGFKLWVKPKCRYLFGACGVVNDVKSFSFFYVMSVLKLNVLWQNKRNQYFKFCFQIIKIWLMKIKRSLFLTLLVKCWIQEDKPKAVTSCTAPEHQVFIQMDKIWLTMIWNVSKNTFIGKDSQYLF